MATQGRRENCVDDRGSGSCQLVGPTRGHFPPYLFWPNCHPHLLSLEQPPLPFNPHPSPNSPSSGPFSVCLLGFWAWVTSVISGPRRVSLERLLWQPLPSSLLFLPSAPPQVRSQTHPPHLRACSGPPRACTGLGLSRLWRRTTWQPTGQMLRAQPIGCIAQRRSPRRCIHSCVHSSSQQFFTEYQVLGTQQIISHKPAQMVQGRRPTQKWRMPGQWAKSAWWYPWNTQKVEKGMSRRKGGPGGRNGFRGFHRYTHKPCDQNRQCVGRSGPKLNSS